MNQLRREVHHYRHEDTEDCDGGPVTRRASFKTHAVRAKDTHDDQQRETEQADQVLLALAVATLGDNQPPELFYLLVLLRIIAKLWEPVLVEVGYICIQVLHFRYVIITFELPLLDWDVVVGEVSNHPPIHSFLVIGPPVLAPHLWLIQRLPDDVDDRPEEALPIERLREGEAAFPLNYTLLAELVVGSLILLIASIQGPSIVECHSDLLEFDFWLFKHWSVGLSWRLANFQLSRSLV